MSGPPLLLLHLSQNFQVRVKDVRNIYSNCGYIKMLENCYIPDFKMLYSKSSTFATSTWPKSSCWGERCTKKYFLLKLEAKDVTNFGSNWEYNRPFVHSIYQIRMYYLPSSPLLLLHLIQNLQVGVKDEQKRLFFKLG